LKELCGDELLCGVETKLMHDTPVDIIKEDTVRYVASLVMEHLSGIPSFLSIFLKRWTGLRRPAQRFF
jgi:hypothetical protein